VVLAKSTAVFFETLIAILQSEFESTEISFYIPDEKQWIAGRDFESRVIRA
jgi:hypothetical protein